MMKLRVDDLAWLALVVSLFCFLSLYVRGPEPRVANDYLSDISLMRFQQGDWSSLIVTNRSPVLAFSIPYGAWPPLHTMVQAVWSLFGMKLEYARFMTGMMASLSFALLTLLVLRQLIQTDAVIVASASLVSPIVIFFVWHGMTHVLIPCSIMAGLWLVIHNIEREKCFWGMNLVVGFILGLTDWFTYGLIPALFIVIIIEKFYYNNKNSIPRNLLYKIVLSLSLGFTISFISYKISEYLILYNSNIIFFKEGLTISKLYHRIFPSIHMLMYAIFYTVVRFSIVFIPILLVNRISGGYTIKQAIRVMPFKFRFILLVALLVPFCFAAIFPVQVHPANHRMQTLSFLPSAMLLLGFLISKTSVNYLRKSMSIALLTLIAIYGIAGYLVVPDTWVTKETFPDLVYPLPVGDYDLSIDQPTMSMTKILKTINNQMMTYPCCDERLVKLNAFHQSWNDIKQYGAFIRQHTQPDEMIVYFGGFTPGFSYYTKRVENSISHIQNFNHLMNQHGDTVKIVLLVPEKSSIEKLYEIDSFSKKIINTEIIDGTPYKLVRFKMEENDGF